MRFLRQSMIGLFLAAVALGLLGFAVSTVGNAVSARMSEEPRIRPARERVFTVNVVTDARDIWRGAQPPFVRIARSRGRADH